MSMAASKASRRWSTMDILILAVVSVIGGILSAYAVGPWAKFIEGVMGPFGAALDNPFFVIWYIIVGLIVQKPGITFIAGLLTGLVEVLAGSLDGSIVFVFVALQGLGAELGLAAFGYKPSWGAALLSGALAGVGAFIPLRLIFAFAKLPAAASVGLLVALAAGDGIIGGGLASAIVQALQRTGVMGRAKAV